MAAAALLLAPQPAGVAGPPPGGAPLLQAAGKPVPLSPASRLRSNGMGAVRAGMTVAEAEQATGMTLRPEGLRDFGGRCYSVRPPGRDLGVYFRVLSDRPVKSYRDGVIGSAVSSGRVIPTGEGLRTGDTEARVRRLYPGKVRAQPHKYVPGGKDLFARGAPGFTLRFETDARGRVTVMHGGKSDAASLVEGCA